MLYFEYTSPWAGFKITTLVVISTDCIGRCKSNYHTIMDVYVYVAAMLEGGCCQWQQFWIFWFIFHFIPSCVSEEDCQRFPVRSFLKKKGEIIRHNFERGSSKDLSQQIRDPCRKKSGWVPTKKSRVLLVHSLIFFCKKRWYVYPNTSFGSRTLQDENSHRP